MYTETMKKGEDYAGLPDTIAINIVDYDFPRGGGVHTRFRLREVSDPSVELTGAMEIHFINMVKWRGQAARDFAGNPLHRWLAWLDPQSPPELIEEVKGMDGAVAYADDRQAFVMSDAEAREVYEALQKAERDRRSEITFAVEAAVADREATIADREAAIAEWQGVVADKDTVIADQEAEIERLQARLAELGE